MSNHIEHIIKMKKAILTLAVLCGIGMTAMAQTDIQNDTAIFPYDMFLAPEHLPEFIGGEDSLYAFLKKNVHYPKEAIEKKVEGKVFVSFIVEKDGSITNDKIVRDIIYGSEEADSLAAKLGCGAETLRVIKMMPKWKPTVHKGQTVRFQIVLGVKFSLTKGIINPYSNQ